MGTRCLAASASLRGTGAQTCTAVGRASAACCRVLPAAVSCAAGAALQVLRCRYCTALRPPLLNPAHSLHAAVCRYRLTGGSKFGADYLVYPGDPTLYHAQFCVRLMPYRQPITPSMMASATRGSHQVGWACARARAAGDVVWAGALGVWPVFGLCRFWSQPHMLPLLPRRHASTCSSPL